MGRIGDKDREPDSPWPKSGNRCLVLLFLLLFIQVSGRAEEAPSPEGQLRDLLKRAHAWHPSVKVAQEELSALAAERRAVRGFYDPKLYVSTGASRFNRQVPGTTGGYTLSNDATSVESGIERPLLPGVYGGVGAGYRYFWNGDDEAPMLQNVIGGQLRIPLLRDRGFQEFTLAERRAIADFQAGASRLLAAEEDLQHDVTLAFIALYEARGLWEAARAATLRVTNLLAEAEQLAKLKVVPEYQLNQATLEVALGQEEEAGAKETYELAREALARLTGVAEVEAPPTASAAIIAWAGQVPPTANDELADVLRRRGSWLNLYHQQLSALVAQQQAAESRKADLSLQAGVTWQGESDDGGFGDERLTSDNHTGAYVQVVYSRPWGFTEANERLAAAKARVEALEQQMQTESLRLETAINQARQRLESGHGRLALATSAVDLAGRTLGAESERFRLGESLSRNVLDAQKDLTNTIRLQTRNAAGLLRALADYRYHAGLPADGSQSTSSEGVDAP